MTSLSISAALKAVQKERPSYQKGAENWWGEVIRRTAIHAGANEQTLDAALPKIVKQLMKRFSSREGYKAFDDAIPTIRHLRDRLNVRTAVLSNGDNRIRAVLKDLEFPETLDAIVLSEKEGIEKPAREIFAKTLELVSKKLPPGQNNIRPEECLHVGDELICDYKGAFDFGMKALLLRRNGPGGENDHKDEDEVLDGVEVINNLEKIIPWVQEHVG